jgi:thioredoxin 1
MVGAIAYLDDQTFDQTIRTGVILIDFYADWCGPCRMLTPVLEQVAQELQGKVSIGKLDIDKNQKVASTYQVTSVPTMILFKNGKEVGRLVGLRDGAGIKQFINTAI